MSKKNILTGSKRFSVFFVLAVFMSVLAFPFIKSSKVFADAPPNKNAIKNGTYTWYDRNTIHATIGGVTYYFRANHSDSYLHYDVKDSDCYGRLSFDSDNPFYVVGAASSLAPDEVAPKSINVDMDFKDPTLTSTNCQNTSPNELNNIKIGSPENFVIYFRLSDDGRHLQTVGDDGNNYTQSGKYANLFTRDSENGDDCQDVIKITSDHKHYISYELDKNGVGGDPPSDIHAPSDCKVTGHRGYVKMAVQQLLGNPSAFQNNPNPDPSAGGAGASGPLSSCDVSLSSPLSWILCPLIDMGSTTSDFIFSQVAQPLLEDVPISTDRNTGTYRAWQGFRFLANIMLIGSMLAIVYSQAKGEK